METDYYERKLQRSGRDVKGCLYCLIGFVIILLMLLFTSCKSVKYVPVVEHHTEYVTKTDTFIQRDSVFQHDSVFIHMKGDTVWYEKWHTRYIDRWHERIVSDTIMRADSIPVPYPVEPVLFPI